jgi:hypothetical protein
LLFLRLLLLRWLPPQLLLILHLLFRRRLPLLLLFLLTWLPSQLPRLHRLFLL